MSNRKVHSSRTRGSVPSPGSSGLSSRRTHVTGPDTMASRRASNRTDHGPKTPQVGTNARVEQITNESKLPPSAPIDTGQGKEPDKDPCPEQSDPTADSTQMDTLGVPDVDLDESSEASSMQSGPSDHGHSGDDESIAVDCHTNPSEVIVKGKNVKQIRVKFPPHPPASDDVPRKKSGRSRLHRPLVGSNLKETTSPTDSNDEKLPYPCEETSLPAISETGNESVVGPVPVLHHQESCISLHSQEAPHNLTNRSMISSNRLSAIDWNVKYKQDILAGIEYFEQKAADLKDLNNRVTQELERVKLENEELEERLHKLNKEKDCLAAEVDELKIRLDQSEKENCIVQGQAMSQWNERIALEEKFVEIQRDKTREISSLKEKLIEKDKEIKLISLQKNTDSSSNIGGDASKALSQGNKRNPSLSDDHFDLLHTISRLQEDVRRHNRDRDLFAEVNNKLHQEVEDMKAALKVKVQELDSQSKRFISLKKSFNDLHEEHEMLKVQLRGRSMSQSHVLNVQREQTAANTTWPATSSQPTKNSLTTVELESVSYIDLPKGHSRTNSNNGASFKSSPGGSQKLPKGPNGHSSKSSKAGSQKRTKSEVINLTDNLPPVANPSR